MATMQELESALIKADAAGNAADAKVFADEIRRMRATTAAPTGGGVTTSREPDGALRIDMAHQDSPRPPGAPLPLGQENVNTDMAGAAEPPYQRTMGERMGRQVGLTARAGLSGLAALPSAIWNGPVGVLNQYAGTNIPRADVGPALNAIGLPKPENRVERVAQDVSGAMASTGGMLRLGETLGNAGIPVVQRVGQLLSAAPASQVAGAAGSAAGSGTARELGFGPGVQTLAGLAGGVASSGAVNGYANRQARLAAEASVPTVEQLRQRAGGLFEHAHERGITASQDQTQNLAGQMRSLAQQEGLISPTGRISEAYPKAREALRMLDDYAEGTMDPRQMQSVRKVLSDAAGSSDRAERRIAAMMLDQFDDFVSPLAPDFAQARQLYSRAMRGEQLERMAESAGLRGSQFTNSGAENALRTEYRQLAQRINRGQERGWSPEQVDLIKRVAKGTGASNALRGVGKLAPTGVVSLGITSGVPFSIGNAIGGPVLGSTLALGTQALGFGARELATRKILDYVNDVGLAARNGGLLAVPTQAQTLSGLLGGGVPQGLLSGQASVMNGR